MTSNKHIFLLKDNVKKEEPDSQETIQIVSLKNPATGNSSKYMFRDDLKQVYEITCFSDNYRSWFLNETICSNGKFNIPVQIDPLFLVLPYIEKSCTAKAIPLDDILVDEDYPETRKLVPVTSSTQLQLISDEKKAAGIKAYKFNEEKALNWLKRKCLKLEKVLNAQRKFTESQNYIKNEKENVREEGEMLEVAHGIISDYISLDLSKKLGKTIGLPDEKVGKKRKSTQVSESNQIKKIKIEETHLTTPIKPVEKRITTKAKALAKAASGTKSIASFFKK